MQAAKDMKKTHKQATSVITIIERTGFQTTEKIGSYAFLLLERLNAKSKGRDDSAGFPQALGDCGWLL